MVPDTTTGTGTIDAVVYVTCGYVVDVGTTGIEFDRVQEILYCNSIPVDIRREPTVIKTLTEIVIPKRYSVIINLITWVVFRSLPLPDV